MEPNTHITEIFSSIQGEGPAAGRRHLFVRFETCDADCAYCDTPGSLVKNPTCRVETEPGTGMFREIPNPVSAGRLGEAIRTLNGAGTPHDAVALTGGEPLLQADFIAYCARNHLFGTLPLYLETDGNLPERLHKVIAHIHTVAADIKIPSATGEREKYKANERFLSIATRKDCFVKIVYGATTTPEEILAAARIVARVDRHIPFILQPVTPCRRVTAAPAGEQTLQLQAAARSLLPDVRVIPQMHRVLGLP